MVLGIMPSSKQTKSGKIIEEWKEKGFKMSTRDLPNDKNKNRKYRVKFFHIEDSLQYDVVEDARKIEVPVIFIARELDTTCLPKYVKEIYDNANEPKKFILTPGIGHDYC